MTGKSEPDGATSWILEAPFRPEGPFGWVARLPAELHSLTDGNEEPSRSRLQLFEGEAALGPAHGVHETIRNVGGGRYSFWYGAVYFATSDNSDPNSNGRTYTARLPADPERKTWPLPAPFRRAGTAGWIAELPPELHDLTDSNEHPHRCRLRLLEEGQRLGPAHTVHDTIQKAGRGGYSVWGNVVYFSASDNSDPNINGGRYSALLEPAKDVHALAASTAGARPVWTRPDKTIRCAVVGVGNRGLWLGGLAQGMAGVEVAWLIDHSPSRLADAMKLFGKDVRGATRMDDMLTDPGIDAVIVTVPDDQHRHVAEAAFRAGKHVFLEKPLATTAIDAKAILAAWQQSGRILQLGYAYRQAPFYAAIRALVRQDVLGPIRIAASASNWNCATAAPTCGAGMPSRSGRAASWCTRVAMTSISYAGCWLLDARPRTVTSFGGLDTFVGPPPAPFCSQCPRHRDCSHVDTALNERRSAAEGADPTAFGLDRCVYRDDKDIIDNQVVSFELDNGTRGTFYLAMQGPRRGERRVTLIGDRARLDGLFEDGQISVTFTDIEQSPIDLTTKESSQEGHGGGDIVTMHEFLNACAGRAPAPVTDVDDAIRGLVFAFAAEQARLDGTLVKLTGADFALPSST